MKIKKRYVWLGILMTLILTFALGPRPSYPPIDPDLKPLDLELASLDNHVNSLNSSVEKLKEDNEGRIIWANDTLKEQTEYSVLFLHGFSASPREGYPMVPDFAKRYGFNSYLPLLSGHGVDSDDSFIDISPADLIHSAKDALALNQVLGKKTIIIGSSTGCTLAIYLAAKNPEAIEGMYLFSPNIDLADKTSRFLLYPWGLQFGRWVIGKRRTIEEWANSPSAKFWTTTYRTEGVVALKYLLSQTMTEDVFAGVKQPFYASYYYKNEEECDHVISIPAVKNFFEKTATPPEQKKLVANPDANAHVMTCDLRVSPEVLENTMNEMYQFGEQVIGIRPYAQPH